MHLDKEIELCQSMLVKVIMRNAKLDYCTIYALCNKQEVSTSANEVNVSHKAQTIGL